MAHRNSTPAPPRRGAGFASSRLGGVLGIALVVSTGCRDSGSDPLATLVATETVPAVAVPVDLPTLGVLAAKAEVREELAPVLDAWLLAWEADDRGLGRAARDEAIRQAAPALSDALGAGGVSTTLQPLFEVQEDLGEIGSVPADLVPALEEIRSLMSDTRAALDEGRIDRALTVGLQASDRVRELGPRAVARTLIARADRALVGGQVTGAIDARSLARGERLLAGARSALEEGEVDLAIERAYYAAQLLEGGGDDESGG